MVRRQMWPVLWVDIWLHEHDRPRVGYLYSRRLNHRKTLLQIVWCYQRHRFARWRKCNTRDLSRRERWSRRWSLLWWRQEFRIPRWLSAYSYQIYFHQQNALRNKSHRRRLWVERSCWYRNTFHLHLRARECQTLKWGPYGDRLSQQHHLRLPLHGPRLLYGSFAWSSVPIPSRLWKHPIRHADQTHDIWSVYTASSQLIQPRFHHRTFCRWFCTLPDRYLHHRLLHQELKQHYHFFCNSLSRNAWR